MSKYEVIIYWSKDDQAFMAGTPELGLYSRWGYLPGSTGERGNHNSGIDRDCERPWPSNS